MFDDIPSIDKIETVFKLPENPYNYTKLDFFKNWIVGFTCPSLYPGVVEFAQANPITYKRIKREFKNLCSNRESYNYLKRILLMQQRLINTNKRKQLNSVKLKNTEVVIWGSNLCSTAGAGRFTNIVKNMIQLPPYQKSVVVGLVLSDGYLSSSKPHENPHLTFKQGLNNSKYLLFVYYILSHYCNIYPNVSKSIRKDQPNFGLYFRTRGLPCFNEIRSLFYIDNKKIVPENIYNLLTSVALAHWIMGDGVARKSGLILCTDSYELFDVIRLINVLMIKYRLDCTLRYHTPTQPRIYIRERSMSIVRELVKLHMVKSMMYKIGL